MNPHWKPDWFLPSGAVPSSKSGDKELRVCAYETEGQIFVEVRLWRRREEWQPGSSIRLHLSQIPALQAAIERAREAGTWRLTGGGA